MEFVLPGSRGVDLNLPSPLVELVDERVAARGVQLLVKREDLIHPDLPGNKWRKLKHNLDAAVLQGQRTLLTFGGAYSNHIRAVAAAGAVFGFHTIGVIRGEEHLPLNPSLAYAVSRGMQLTYMDRRTYRSKDSRHVIDMLHHRWGNFYLLPEGGSNELAVRGCAEIPAEIDHDFDIICSAVGTGGTLAGIAAGLKPGRRAVGFSSLKGAHFLDDEVKRLQHATFGYATGNWRIVHDFHFGGFAKRTSALDDFIAGFAEMHGIKLEWVYVAKMMFGIYALIETLRLTAGNRVVAVITGSDFGGESKESTATPAL